MTLFARQKYYPLYQAYTKLEKQRPISNPLPLNTFLHNEDQDIPELSLH